MRKMLHCVLELEMPLYKSIRRQKILVANARRVLQGLSDAVWMKMESKKCNLDDLGESVFIMLKIW